MEDHLHDLCHDFLDLAEKHSNKFPVQEFGYCMIKMATKMLADCHPNRTVSSSTALAGVIEGLKWKLDEDNEQKSDSAAKK